MADYDRRGGHNNRKRRYRGELPSLPEAAFADDLCRRAATLLVPIASKGFAVLGSNAMPSMST